MPRMIPVCLMLASCVCAQAIDAQKKAALDEARKAGVLTQQEYDAKLKALQGGKPAASAPAAGTGMARGGKRTISVADPMFGLPAYSVEIPSDWRFEGAMLPGSCGNDIPMIVFRAYSADGLTGIQVMPRVDWYSAQDKRAFQMAGVAPCNYHLPAHAADVAAQIATGLRTGSQVVRTAAYPAGPAATFKNAIDGANANIQAANARMPGFTGGVTGDASRVRLRYDYEGHPIEEWVNVSISVWDQPVTVMGSGPGGVVQPGVAHLMHSMVNVGAMHAPAGRLDADEPMLWEISQSLKMLPEYQKTYSDFMQRRFENVMASIRQAGQAALAQGARDGAALQRQNDQFHAWQQESRERNRQNFERDMARKDGAAKDFLDYVKDQTYYVNPATGATITIQNQTGVTGYVTQNSWGNWTALVPIHH